MQASKHNNVNRRAPCGAMHTKFNCDLSTLDAMHTSIHRTLANNSMCTHSNHTSPNNNVNRKVPQSPMHTKFNADASESQHTHVNIYRQTAHGYADGGCRSPAWYKPVASIAHRQRGKETHEHTRRTWWSLEMGTASVGCFGASVGCSWPLTYSLCIHQQIKS